MDRQRDGVVIITPGRPVKENRYRGTCPYCNCTAEFPYQAVSICTSYPDVITVLCPNCERAYNDGKVKLILTAGELDVPSKRRSRSWWKALLSLDWMG